MGCTKIAKIVHSSDLIYKLKDFDEFFRYAVDYTALKDLLNIHSIHPIEIFLQCSNKLQINITQQLFEIQIFTL